MVSIEKTRRELLGNDDQFITDERTFIGPFFSGQSESLIGDSNPTI